MMDNDRSVSTNKMYPIDLAPQKITLMKNVNTSEIKMAHLITNQPKTTVSGQIISHTGPIGLMRTTNQIISSNAAAQSQPQMIVAASTMLQGAQIVSQGSQILGQGSQVITQPQIINATGQIVSPGTQIISQGSQLSSQIVSTSGTTSTGTTHVSIASPAPQVFNVGTQIASGATNLIVNSAVRTLPPSVRVLPPLPQHNARPVLSNVSLSNSISVSGVTNSVVVTKPLTSHVPRGPAIGASLAVPRARPLTPVNQPISLNSAWNAAGRAPRVSPPRPRNPLVTTTSLGTSGSGVITSAVRGPRPLQLSTPLLASSHVVQSQLNSSQLGPNQLNSGQLGQIQLNSTQLGQNQLNSSQHAPNQLNSAQLTPNQMNSSQLGQNQLNSSQLAPNQLNSAQHTSIQINTSQLTSARPLPLLQRNYQTPKVVGPGVPVNTGCRGGAGVGNSAPPQLYYEVQHPVRSYHPLTHPVSVVNTICATSCETRPVSAVPATTTSSILPRPTILRKRDIDGSVSEMVGGPGSGGSTTESAPSSPAPSPDPPLLASLAPLAPLTLNDNTAHNDNRKKPRKQMLSDEVREFQMEEPPPTPPTPPTPTIRPPKRPQLSSSFVCGWRATALHFVRPSDVRRRSPRPRDILSIASQRHVLAAADGWKVHHLTAQMDDLVSLESDVGDQLAEMLKTIESAHGKAQSALAPHLHNLLELVKGNIQRSRIVCEGVQEAREDILRVFTHRNFVADILSRQADKRCFRKHRIQS